MVGEGKVGKGRIRQEKVRERKRRQETVGEGKRRQKKVGEGKRKQEKVREGRRRKEKVRKGKGRQEKVKEYRRWKGTYRTNKDDRGKDGQSKVNFDGKGGTSRQNKAKENGYGCKGIWEVGRVEKSNDWMDLKRIFYVHQSDEEISSKKGGILDIVRSNFRNLYMG